MPGNYLYTDVTEYEELSMPTQMHELSVSAVSMSQPLYSLDREAWKNIAPSATMTQDALTLKDYCTNAGLSPLSSEWWHFNDLDCL